MSILVLGDVILDEYWIGSSTRLSPEAPVPVILNPITKKSPGGAANVALNIKSMGSLVKLISQVDENFDTELLGNLPTGLLRCEQTPHKTRIIGENHIICRIDRELFQPVNAQEFWIEPSYSICVLSDYNKGFLNDRTQIIKWCNDKNIKTIVDPKCNWKAYSGCWLLKANANELRDQIGRNYTIDELEEICSLLSNSLLIANIIVTLGESGLFLYTKNGSKHIHVEGSHVVDVTGAGDVVIAALAHYTDLGVDLVTTAERAVRLATISVSKQGSYIVTQEDIASVEHRVIFTNGCFDILHKGHVDYLRQSRALGTRLIVGLNSDTSVRQLKGVGRPINKQEDRKALLESLEFVDEVIIFDEPTPRELILKVKPDIITKGGDYTVDQVVGNDLVNQVIIIPIVENHSTTNILERLEEIDEWLGLE